MSAFAAFLHRKIEIEAKVNHLQRTYLQLLRAPIQSLDLNEESKAASEKILKQKLEKCENITAEYLKILKTHRELHELVAEAKEDCREIEQSLDNLFEVLQIENPEPLANETKENDLSSATLKLEAVHLRQQNESILTESDANISARKEEEEEDDNSDKENYQSSPQSDSENSYFSPNIQISKSIRDTDAECFTPAIKSHSKLPVYRSGK